MTPEQAVELRKPFAPESVGKLPRVSCRGCRDVKGACDKHRMLRCDVCGNWITSAHLHLDYVGHAEITDRLLAVDPQWTWEPAALGQDGLPQMGHGGLWIRLTVAGVTRLGFGSADGKSGPDAVKEMIGDALRNAAMRFGVGLDLWGAKYKGGEDGHHETAEQAQEPVDPAEQEMLLAGFMAEIDAATHPEQIVEIGKRVRENPRISPATYDRLNRHAAKRRAELNGAGEPATVTAPADTSTRRGGQLAAMDQRVAKRKEPANAQ